MGFSSAWLKTSRSAGFSLNLHTVNARKIVHQHPVCSIRGDVVFRVSNQLWNVALPLGFAFASCLRNSWPFISTNSRHIASTAFCKRTDGSGNAADYVAKSTYTTIREVGIIQTQVLPQRRGQRRRRRRRHQTSRVAAMAKHARQARGDRTCSPNL